MIINSTNCKPRKIAKSAINTFLKAYKLPTPRIRKAGKHTILYFWNDFAGKNCFSKLWMNDKKFAVTISEDNNSFTCKLPYKDEYFVEDSVVACLEMFFKNITTGVYAP